MPGDSDAVWNRLAVVAAISKEGMADIASIKGDIAPESVAIDGSGILQN